MKFVAEIKKTEQNKTASLDNVYKLTLVSDDPRLMDFGKFPPDTTVNVEIQESDGKPFGDKEPS